MSLGREYSEHEPVRMTAEATPPPAQDTRVSHTGTVVRCDRTAGDPDLYLYDVDFGNVVLSLPGRDIEHS